MYSQTSNRQRRGHHRLVPPAPLNTQTRHHYRHPTRPPLPKCRRQTPPGSPPPSPQHPWSSSLSLSLLLSPPTAAPAPPPVSQRSTTARTTLIEGPTWHACTYFHRKVGDRQYIVFRGPRSNAVIGWVGEITIGPSHFDILATWRSTDAVGRIFSRSRRGWCSLVSSAVRHGPGATRGKTAPSSAVNGRPNAFTVARVGRLRAAGAARHGSNTNRLRPGGGGRSTAAFEPSIGGGVHSPADGALLPPLGAPVPTPPPQHPRGGVGEGRDCRGSAAAAVHLHPLHGDNPTNRSAPPVTAASCPRCACMCHRYAVVTLGPPLAPAARPPAPAP